MNCENLTVGQLASILSAMSRTPVAGPLTSAPFGGSEWKIVVADRGFVLHGQVRREGEYVVIDSCVCVRYWGTPTQNTDSGLGFLAKNGPTKETKLDRQPTTRIHELQIVQLIDCEKPGAFYAK